MVQKHELTFRFAVGNVPSTKLFSFIFGLKPDDQPLYLIKHHKTSQIAFQARATEWNRRH